MASRIAVMLPLFCSLLCTPALHSQEDLQTELRGVLLHQTVTLRHFYKDDKQTYDASGAPRFNTEECSWTLCSMLWVDKVEVGNDKVEVKGRRLLTEFSTGSPKAQKQNERISIIIELAPEPDRKKQLRSALRAIFLGQDEKLSALLPPLWRDYLAGENRKLMNKSAAQVPYSGGITFRIVKGMTPPKPLSTPDPYFTDDARKNDIQGSVLFWCVVDTDGKLHDIRLVRALGYGLDERAAAALQTWQFKPAQKDGADVPVAVDIQVNFRLTR